MTKITSREALETTTAECVRLKLAHASQTAKLESEKIALEKKAAPQLASLEQQITAHENQIQAYCVANRAALFPHSKTLELRTATLAFEWTPPRVDKLRRVTWAAVLERLAALPWAGKYIRQPEPEVNKKALLDDREVLTPEQREQIGINFAQEEQFRLTPRPEMLQPTVGEI
jgi:phage host-nuclease inhibitor protein Gam